MSLRRMPRRKSGRPVQRPAPILVVEDNQGDAELIKLALQKAGFDEPAVWVDSGEAAVAYLEGRGPFADRREYPQPLLILLDLKLAKLSGFAVLKRQKECKDAMGVPTIVLTGSQNPKDVDRAFDLGAKGYIIKPATFDELVKLLALKGNQCLVGMANRVKRPV